MNRTIREKIQTHFNLTDTLVYYKMIENHDLENAMHASNIMPSMTFDQSKRNAKYPSGLAILGQDQI